MSPHESTPAKAGDYYIFPICLPAQPSFPHLATHFIYLRPHDPKISDPAASRSLFLVNIPFDSTVAHLKHLFSSQIGLPTGRIAEITFHDRGNISYEPEPIITRDALQTGQLLSRKRKRTQAVVDSLPVMDASFLPTWDRELHKPGTSAVLLFVDQASMKVALAAAQRVRSADTKIVWGDGVEEQPPPLGLQRYIKHSELSRPQHSILMERVDEYMSAYDAHIKARDMLLAEQRSVPDADGFVTVNRGLNKRGVKAVKQDTAKEKFTRQEKKREGFVDFYRFQGRERAKARANQLVRKFQQDVSRVKKLREHKGNSKAV